MQTSLIEKWLNFDLMRRVRANHALEHATFHVLAEKGARQAMMGYSDAGGFWVAGDIPEELLAECAKEALARLQGGEEKLAIHEGCGTNLTVSGTIVGGLVWLGMLGAGSGFRRKLERLPLAILLGTAGLAAAQALGPKIQQQITTLPGAPNLRLVGIRRYKVGDWVFQRVSTCRVGE